MDKTQLVSIEITTECNLGIQHARCPNRHPERYRYVNTTKPLTDTLIVQMVTQLYREFGFGGFVGWHYYCEPLCDAGRCLRLMDAIRGQVPEAKFLLWTNGTLLEPDLSIYDAFNGMVVTHYGQGDDRRIKQLAERFVRHGKQAVVGRWSLDGRLEIAGVETNTPCTRPFCEMPIDFYGNVHACCYDWRGGVPLGNLWAEPLERTIARWQAFRDRLLGPQMNPEAPMICRTCNMRPRGRSSGQAVIPILAHCVFAPVAARRAETYVQMERKRRAEDEPKRVAVVIVSYLRVPESRLQEHFAWNDAVYRKMKARVYVVTDREHRLPSYASCVIVPLSALPVVDGQPRFSLSMTKNAGIRQALGDGADFIIASDVDMCFPEPAWDMMLTATATQAWMPIVAMVADPARRRQKEDWLDIGMVNTIAMRASNWMRIKYDEQYVGYGGEDGKILHDIKAASIEVLRDAEVYHVTHPGSQHIQNVPGHGRDGCYGREDGFNFDNFWMNTRRTRNDRPKQFRSD